MEINTRVVELTKPVQELKEKKEIEPNPPKENKEVKTDTTDVSFGTKKSIIADNLPLFENRGKVDVALPKVKNAISEEPEKALNGQTAPTAKHVESLLSGISLT